MSQKVKSPRKRLQIDHTEFAPPTDIYNGSSSPRPDDAWLQFYGGPQEGTLKHLSSLDDEDSLSVSRLTLVSATPSTPSSLPIEYDQLPSVTPPSGGSISSASPTTPGLSDSTSTFPLTNTTPFSSVSNTPSVDTSVFSPSTSDLILSFSDFATQWGHLLKFGKQDGKLRICEVIFNNTHAIGSDSFLSSYDQLGKLAFLSKKACQLIIAQLELSGFVERLAIYNTATRKGTLFRLHLFPSLSSNRKKPEYFLFDSELPT